MDDCDSCKCENEEEEDLSRELAAAFKFLEPKEKNTLIFNSDFSENDSSPHFKIRDYQKQEEKEEAPCLLDPNHPLLEKFQKALKEHLQKQIEHLNTEIFELETGAKKKNRERELIGVEAYEMQQTVCKQQNELEKSLIELQTVSAARVQVENQLEEIESSYKQERIKLEEVEAKEMELRNEIQAMDLLLYQMSSWTQDMESDLIVNQRMSEKTRKDKIKLADEKRKLDMIIYKLMTEVWRLENELESMEMQLRVKEKDRERLAEAVVQSNADIESLESEHRCLIHSWHSVIVAIENRDKHYNVVNKEYQDYVEKVRTIIAEIGQVKKLCKAEMIQNEQLSIFKTRILMDIKSCEYQLELEIRKRNNIEQDMNQTATIMERIDKDIQRLNGEISQREQEFKILLKEFDQLTIEKVKLEEQIILKLQDQITNDKASIYLKKLVTKVKEKNVDIEITLASTENQNAKVMDMSERQKEKNLSLNKKVEDIEVEYKFVDGEIKACENDIKKCNSSIKKREQDFDLLNKKIENILRRSTDSTLSPQEIKIKTLEKNISETIENNKLLQKFWLRAQGHICQLSENRQEQIKEINLLRKQTMLLEQRNLKIDDELESCAKKESEIERSLINLQHKASKLTEQMFKKKDNMNNLTEYNSLQKVEYLSKLKDLELEILKVEADYEELENDKVRLSDELIEKNRERLAWEKKLKLALETKENMKAEKEGELSNMKAEIHRMKVRYGQLKKVQEKLINDMEYCVLRRDSIFTGAEARENRNQEGSSFTRVNFLRKLDDLKNKCKQAENELTTVIKKIGDLKEQETMIEEEYNIIQTEIEEIKQIYSDTEKNIEKAKTQKQLNLEILVSKQKKLKTFSSLVQGTKPQLLFRTESTIIAEYDKQKNINQKLLDVLEFLLTSFPDQSYHLNRIFNTLKLPTLYV